MTRQIRSLLGVCAAAAVLVPVALANPPAGPPGNGLFPHDTHCWGGPFAPPGDAEGTLVHMLVSGDSFWIGNQHYLVQQYTLTWDSDPSHPQTYTKGAKAGLGEPTITCAGHFDELGGYSVESVDVLVK